MNIDCLQTELSARLNGLGKIVISSTSNIPGQPMPRKDTMWLVETVKSGVDFHINGLQAQSQTVIIDVAGSLSLNYILGTPSAQVKNKANAGAIGQSSLNNIVMTYIDIIDDSYNAAINYDKACMLYNQYIGTGQKNAKLLQEAWNTISAVPVHFTPAQQLSSAIQTQAKTDNVQL